MSRWTVHVCSTLLACSGIPTQTWTHANAQAAKPLGEGEEAGLLAVHATAFPARHRPCSLRGLTGSLQACIRRGGGLSARCCPAVSKVSGNPYVAANFHQAAALEGLDKGHAPPPCLCTGTHTQGVCCGDKPNSALCIQQHSSPTPSLCP